MNQFLFQMNDIITYIATALKITTFDVYLLFFILVASVILMILGTMAMHLVVESQNRYHFHTIPLIAILAAVGVVDLVRHSNAKQSDTGGVLEKSAANIERIS